MEVRHRSISGEPLKTQKLKMKHQSESNQVIPFVPLYLTNALFFVLFFSDVYFLLCRWREKIRTSTPLHVVTSSETAAIVSLLASFIYLLGFFGIGFVHTVSSRTSFNDELSNDEILFKQDSRPGPCGSQDDEKTIAIELR